MLDNKTHEIAVSIGNFYLKKNDDDYKKTEEDILNLRIVKLEVRDEVVIITTSRPGLLIGKRGENIDLLSKHLGMKLKIIEDQDNLIDCMIPYESLFVEDSDYMIPYEFSTYDDCYYKPLPCDPDW